MLKDTKEGQTHFYRDNCGEPEHNPLSYKSVCTDTTLIFCKLGFHKWWPDNSNITTPDKIIYRTFLRCKRCGKWGKLTFFKELKI